MPKKKEHEPLRVRREVYDRIEERMPNFTGDIRTLESAMGALIAGQMLGWRAMYLIHSHKTLTKYSKILGFETLAEFRASMPETTPRTREMLVFRIVDGVKDFWDVVAGSSELLTEEQIKRKSEFGT